MIFLAFQSYDESRSGAGAEATLLVQQVETAQFLPQGAATELTGELVCYGRSVAGIEWDAVNPWGRRCSTRSDRSTHRPRPSRRPTTGGWTRPPSGSKHPTGRLHGAQRIIPLPVGIALYSILGLIFLYMLFFADPREGAIPRAC
jgi:hypothetical protein